MFAKFFSKIILFFLLTPLMSLSLYPFEINKDYYNYYYDYVNGAFSYDVGYEWVSYFFREIIGFDFEQFWFLIVLLEYFFIVHIYKAKVSFALMFVTVIWMCQFFLGTQVRFALACLIYLYAFLYLPLRYKWFIYIFCILFHYGLIVIFFLEIVASCLKINSLIKIRLRYIVFFVLGIAIAVFLVNQINVIVSYTRFSYFTADSEFMQSKSWTSTVYVLFFLILLVLACIENPIFLSEKLFKLAFVVALFILVFSSVAVLSGRVYLFFALLEPLLISYLFYFKCSNLIRFSLLFLFLIKIFFSLYNSGLYTEHLF